MTTFGSLGVGLVAIGCLISGVIGVLLPKISNGITLGVLLFLLISSFLFNSVPTLSSTTVRLSMEIALMGIGLTVSYLFEEVAVPLRTGLACGMSIALG